MNETLKKKRNVFPVSSVLRSLRLFTILFAFISEIYIISYHAVVWERILPMLPMAIGFATAVLIARSFDNPVLISAGGAILAAGAVFLGYDAVSWVFLGILAVAGFANALRERVRLKKNADSPDNVFHAVIGLVILFLMLCLSWISDSPEAGRFIFAVTMVYFPIAFGTWLYEGIEFYLAQFSDRSSQPVGLVRRSISGWALPLVLLVGIIASFLPYRDGKRMVEYAFFGLAWLINAIITVLGKITGFLTGEEELETTVSPGDLIPNTPIVNEDHTGINRVVSVISLAILGAFILITVGSLIKKLIEAIIAGYALRPDAGAESLEGDVVEQIKPVQREKRRGLFAPKTTAEKVRSVYKNAVAGLYRFGVEPRPSDSPDEICAAAREKGCELGELTEIYKQARYTEDCPEDLLRRAKQLAKHVEPAESK